MIAPQVIVVSLRGSGAPLLAEVTGALGYTPYGTMSGPDDDSPGPGPGEVYPLLAAAHGPDTAAALLRDGRHGRQALQTAFEDAVGALWRVWWIRLGQPVTRASPVDPALEEALARVPDGELVRLLPGRGCWYVNSLDLRRADGGLLRAWQATGHPPIVFHHRDVRDRIISQIQLLSHPSGRVGSQPEYLVYRDIVSALPSMDARITLALTDPGFPGLAEARGCRWLLHHPAVTVVSHEDLAGPAHGGSADARERALARLFEATGHPGSTAVPRPRAAGSACQDPDHLRVGLWREHFSPEHERLLDRHWGDLPARV
ncbi:hypothetical protein [Streptomyces sp. NPDC014894]|uniref:hypothetical protein n=1 Tax=Streptomyces sp. NPDC014894 TaxID=3364931 RepID=UPI0036FD0EC8